MPWRNEMGERVYLHSFLASALDEGERSTSGPGGVTPGETNPATNWVCRRADLDVFGWEKNPLPLPGIVQPLA